MTFTVDLNGAVLEAESFDALAKALSTIRNEYVTTIANLEAANAHFGRELAKLEEKYGSEEWRSARRPQLEAELSGAIEARDRALADSNFRLKQLSDQTAENLRLVAEVKRLDGELAARKRGRK